MAELTFEIGCEEIPSDYITIADRWLNENAKSKFLESGLGNDETRVTIYSAPRRLALSASGLLERQEDREEIVKGPPKKIAFDADGNPTKAALGFARKNNTPVEALEQEGDYLVARVKYEGKPAETVLINALPELFFAIPFPKSMRWGDGSHSFTRPVHWVLCLFDGKPVELSFAGIKAADKTRGHRFMSPDEIKIKDTASYIEELKKARVIVNRNERVEIIAKGIDKITEERGLVCDKPEGLTKAVANLVEFPVPIVGGFDEKFLDLPEEALITSMAKHQRYFALRSADGKLTNSFISISNTLAEDMQPIINGNNRVLRARLEDARFFFEEDKKRELTHFAGGLKDVVFHKRLGSYRDKVERVKALLPKLAELFGAKESEANALEAAELCKADLLTLMVGEFPDLQGVMGREYALHQGVKPQVAAAISEHYLPRGAGDELPASTEGALLAVADKLDTIISCFGTKLKPTGSQDPFALRRACLGILRILEARGLALSSELINSHINFTAKRLKANKLKYGESGAVLNDIIDFIKGRLTALHRKNFRTDIVSAVVEANWQNPREAAMRLKGLSKAAASESFIPLVIAFKRTVNILSQATKKGINHPDKADKMLFCEDAEKILHETCINLSKYLSEKSKSGEYEALFAEIVDKLHKPLDDFFTDVMVMADDEAVRGNRLALLSQIAAIFRGLADFTFIHTEVG